MSEFFKQLVAALSIATAVDIASAATQFETTDLVANTPTAAAQLPPAIDFDIATAGDYVVNLSDLAVPATFDSLQAIVTHDLEVVARLDVDSGAAQAQATITATAGSYRIHVLGSLPAQQEGGTFAVTVAPAAGGNAIVNTGGTITADTAAPPNAALLQLAFELTAAGSYQIAVTDHAFPVALTAPPQIQLLLEDQPGHFTPVTLTGNAFTGQSGSYQLNVFATAAAPEEAGLLSVAVTGPAGAVVFRSTERIGRLPPPIELSLPSTAQYTLTIADTNFPAALTSFSVLVAQNAAVLGQRSGTGSVAIPGNQGTAQLFTFATTPAVGAFGIRLTQGAATIFSDVQAADASPDANTSAIYSFQPSTPIVAGNYRLTLHDFRFPAALPSLHAAVIQGDAIVDSIDQADAVDVALRAGAVKALVAVDPPAGTPSQPSSGLFGIDLSVVQGANVFESTQGVGGLFRSQPVQVPANGSYDLTVADLEFPAALGSSALAVTRGTELVAQIFGGSTVSRTLTAGTYVLNFIGQPAQGQVHGTYGLKVADSPPAPTVTLSAAPATITAGERTTVQWSTTNATACTASNGWTGSKATSGSEQSAVLNANATFELSCSGPGGTTSASASVTVNPPSANGGGGGGSADLPLLIFGAMLWLLRAASRFTIMTRARNAVVMRTH